MSVDDPRSRVATLLAEQAGWCARLGSPLYHDLLSHAAADALSGGPVWRLLEPHAEDPGPSALALRLMGGVHRLVLEGEAPELARHYPSVGGQPAEGAWEAFRAAVQDHLGALRDLVCQPVQTNEVGRSAALLGGFLTVALETALPLRLLELGASAGLNLRWDRYFYQTPIGSWGDPASDVQLRGFLSEGRLPLEAPVEIIDRRGCDTHPVNPTTEEGRLTLLSFVWPDQAVRMDRVRGALITSRAVPATIDREDAGRWLDARLSPIKGSTTVVFHSVVWQYLGSEAQERVRAIIEASGAAAGPEEPVAWLRMEPGGDEAEVRLTQWPDGRERLLATTGFHGEGVRWLV